MKTWANCIPMTNKERLHVILLREAGCKCKIPLLGFIPGAGPRCRMCGVEVVGLHNSEYSKDSEK